MANSLITERGYYLGITKQGDKAYLVKPSWDCGWYWGFGYIQSYTPYHYDWSSHEHWDTLTKDGFSFDIIKDHFKDLTLSDNDLYTLCDYMKSYYTLRRMADLTHCGDSFITAAARDLADFKNDEINTKINQEALPKLFKAVDTLFKEASEHKKEE